MSTLVPASDIESIVHATRRQHAHVGRNVLDAPASGTGGILYVLHSHDCRNTGRDLRDCPYSRAMDNGLDLPRWAAVSDRPVVLGISADRLVPIAPIEDPPRKVSARATYALRRFRHENTLAALADPAPALGDPPASDDELRDLLLFAARCCAPRGTVPETARQLDALRTVNLVPEDVGAALFEDVTT